jgi:hypothetical protein
MYFNSKEANAIYRSLGGSYRIVSNDRTFIRSEIHWSKMFASKVARFFLTQCTKTGKIYQIATKLPTGHNKFRMGIKNANVFQSKALQNLPESGFLVLKYAIWQTCPRGLSTRGACGWLHNNYSEKRNFVSTLNYSFSGGHQSQEEQKSDDSLCWGNWPNLPM